jgi:hypothetical protein
MVLHHTFVNLVHVTDSCAESVSSLLFVSCCYVLLQVWLNRLAPGDLVWTSREFALEARMLQILR